MVRAIEREGDEGAGAGRDSAAGGSAPRGAPRPPSSDLFLFHGMVDELIGSTCVEISPNPTAGAVLPPPVLRSRV